MGLALPTLRTHVFKKMDTTAHTCNPSNEEAHRSLGAMANQPALIGKVQASERPCLKKDKVDDFWGMTPRMSAGLTHICTQVYGYLYAHKYLCIHHTYTHTKIICG